MAAELPKVNYEAPLDLVDIKWEQDVYETEFLRRMQMVMGYTPADTTLTEYGIVDSVDPATVSSSSVRPLVPAKNVTNGARFDVRPGMAVTKSGFVIVVSSTQTSVVPPVSTVGGQFVVFLKYDTEESSTKVLSRWNALTAKTTDVVADSDLLQTDTLANWNNASKYPESVKQHCVVLAVGIVSQTVSGGAVTGTEVVFEYDQVTYDFNRPWFSPVDIKHRSQVGTGTSTSTNIHGLSVSDLSSNGLTLYNQMLNRGMVLSKDKSISKAPGILCNEELAVIQFSPDDGIGSVTGRPGSLYARLSAYPIRVGRSYWDDPAGDDFCGYVIPGTNLFVLDVNETAGGGGVLPGPITVYYLRASACEPPPLEPDLRTLMFGAISSGRELVITDGIAVKALADLSYDASIFGPIPTYVRLYVDSASTWVSNPQCLLPSTRLATVSVGQTNTLNTSLLGPAYIRVGLSGAVDGPTLDVKIRVTGTDVNGTTIWEELAFNGTNYAVPSIPDCNGGYDNRAVAPGGQFLRTSQVFYSVKSWSATARVDDGPNSDIVIHGLLSFTYTEDIREYAVVCDFKWDGLRVCDIRDRRLINKTVAIPEKYNPLVMAARMLTAGGVRTATPHTNERDWGERPEFAIIAEDMEDPRYGALHNPLVHAGDDWEEVIKADHWLDGMGEACFEGPDVESSTPFYVSRGLYVPHEGVYMPADGYPEYNGCRLMLLWDDDEDRSTDFWGTGRRSVERPLTSFRFAPTTAMDTWSSWIDLPMDANRFVNVWYLQTTSPSTQNFYKFQVAVKGIAGVRGWVTYWEKLAPLAGDTYYVGMWDVDGYASPIVITDVSNNPLYVISGAKTGAYSWQFDFTFGGTAPPAADYDVWIEGADIAYPVVISAVYKSGVNGRFTVYAQTIPLHSGDAVFHLFIRVNTSLP